MFRIFKFVKFLKWSRQDTHPDDWVWNILELRSDSLRIVWKLSGKFHFSFSSACLSEVRHIVSNITKDAVHLQITWKSISANGYVTYNACTTYKSDYLSAINQMRRIGDYSLKDAELLADSPFVDIFFGMQPTQQEIENSPLEELLTSVN